MQESQRSEESTKVVETERSAREVDELEADGRVFGSDKRNGGNTKKRANKKEKNGKEGIEGSIKEKDDRNISVEQKDDKCRGGIPRREAIERRRTEKTTMEAAEKILLTINLIMMIAESTEMATEARM